jgi:hypothetical protein
MQQFFSLLSWCLFTAQQVSGVFSPIIRGSMTAVAASGFTSVSWWQSCCVRGRAGRPAGPTTNTARLSPRYGGKTRGCHCSQWASDDGRKKRPKHVELWTNFRIINWKIVASGWWFIWTVRWCTDLQTLNFTFNF